MSTTIELLLTQIHVTRAVMMSHNQETQGKTENINDSIFKPSDTRSRHDNQVKPTMNALGRWMERSIESEQ